MKKKGERGVVFDRGIGHYFFLFNFFKFKPGCILYCRITGYDSPRGAVVEIFIEASFLSDLFVWPSEAQGTAPHAAR